MAVKATILSKLNKEKRAVVGRTIFLENTNDATQEY